MEVRAVFLVGFMASGKSWVGSKLARRWNWDFVDLDARIEAREQQTVAEIFRQRGESGFRSAETSALCDLTQSLQRDSVIALGGGAFVQQRNRELLGKWPTVFLEAPTSEMWLRSSKERSSSSSKEQTERPLRGDPEQFAKLYAERLPIYRQASVTIVTSGKDLDSICTEIERRLQCWGKREPTGSQQVPPSHSRTGESE
jgi:shikimate kinase